MTDWVPKEEEKMVVEAFGLGLIDLGGFAATVLAIGTLVGLLIVGAQKKEQ